MSTREVIAGRVCTGCGEWKLSSDFYKCPKSPGGHRSACKSCSVAYGRKRRLADRDRVTNIRRKSHIKIKYGISIEQYNQMLERQNGKCQICFCVFDLRGSQRTMPHIDHDHSTGKVRGLLCHGCNSAIGYAREDIDLLVNCIKYLRKHHVLQ